MSMVGTVRTEIINSIAGCGPHLCPPYVCFTNAAMIVSIAARGNGLVLIA
jgi:hypothetical protein